MFLAYLRSRRSIVMFCLLGCVGVGIWLVGQLRAAETTELASQAQDQETSPEELKAFMRQKLEHSKAILEGLAVEDFALIRKNSQALGLLSLESNWNRLQTEEYIEKSREFRRAAESIREAADKENLEGAALRYVSLTVQCVECHKYLRHQVVVKKP